MSSTVVAELPDTDADGVALAADGSLLGHALPPRRTGADRAGGRVELVVDDHLAQTFDAPTNIAWIGTSLDRVVVANVGDTFLSIGDVGITGQALHYPEVD